MSENKASEPHLIKEHFQPALYPPSSNQEQGQTNLTPNNGNTGQQSTPNTDNGTTKQ